MSDLFVLRGRAGIIPSNNTLDVSGDFEISTELIEQVEVVRKVAGVVSLDADPAEVVNLGDLAVANVILLRSSAKVSAVLTSLDGASQIVPVDPFFTIVSLSVGFTALSLIRIPSVITRVRYMLAQAR